MSKMKWLFDENDRDDQVSVYILFDGKNFHHQIFVGFLTYNLRDGTWHPDSQMKNNVAGCPQEFAWEDTRDYIEDAYSIEQVAAIAAARNDDPVVLRKIVAHRVGDNDTLRKVYGVGDCDE